jgi:hypothetical protein
MATRNILVPVSTLLSLYRNGTKFVKYHTEGKNYILHSDITPDKRTFSFRYNNSVTEERDYTVLHYPLSTLLFQNIPEPASGCQLCT